MPKLGTWKCQICHEEVKEIGAFVKLSLGKYAHLLCYATKIRGEGYAQGRDDLLHIQEEERVRAETERKIREEREKNDAEVHLRNHVQNLKRCVSCGRRIFSANDSSIAVHSIDPEAVQPSVGPLARRDTCANCVEAERVARNSARQQLIPSPSATKTVQQQANEHHAQFPKGCGLSSCDVCKALVTRPDRFALIETD